MVSKGFLPGCEEAKEAWPRGCQSWVRTTLSNFATSRLITGTTSSPFRTASAPPGQKSFCTSTTMRHCMSFLLDGEAAGEREAALALRRHDDHFACCGAHAGQGGNGRAMRHENEVRSAALLASDRPHLPDLPLAVLSSTKEIAERRRSF